MKLDEVSVGVEPDQGSRLIEVTHSASSTTTRPPGLPGSGYLR